MFLGQKKIRQTKKYEKLCSCYYTFLLSLFFLFLFFGHSLEHNWALLKSTVIRMLNCARGEGTTYSAIKEFAKQPNCTVFMLQEPWSAKNKPHPDHPDFTIFSPSTKNPKCATYIRISACLQPYVHFQYSNFGIAIIIQPIDHPLITIYNVYSPGRQIHAADLLPEHIPKLLCYIDGRLKCASPIVVRLGGNQYYTN
jgi:hypothetical protein